MKLHIRLLALLACAGAVSSLSAQAVHKWEVFELSLNAQGELANPYIDGLPGTGRRHARVAFTGVSGEAQGKRLTTAAFWDGEKTWKVRFAPPAAGEWTYATESADPGLNGKSGSFLAVEWTEEEKKANPARRGFVRVARGGPRPGRYFQYADGTPFLWIGDTWWNWSKKGIQFPTFRKLADDRAAKGFTVGQLFVPGNSGRVDLDQVRRVEQMIAYANSRGITVWIHPWWSGKGFSQRVGAEPARRWWWYVIDRLGAYNVIWVLAGEYNMEDYGGMGLDFWKQLGAMIRREDPWERLIGAHPTPPGWSGGAAAPQWSTAEVLHGEPWLDYNQSQVGHGKARNEMIPSAVSSAYAHKPAKPIVVTEPWYEFIAGNPPGEDVRFGAWSAVLSGAAGHTYGGGHVWWAHVPEAPASQGAWPLHKEFDTDTLDYPGAVSVSFLAKFMAGIEWWKLAPHPELVSDYPLKFCASDPGKSYVVYLRWGGGLKLDLRQASGQDTFECTWIDLVERKERKAAVVNGGAIREFNAPDGYPTKPQFKDWVLHIRLKK